MASFMPSDRSARISHVQSISSELIKDLSALATTARLTQRLGTFCMARRPALLMRSNLKYALEAKYGRSGEKQIAVKVDPESEEDMQSARNQIKPRPIRNLAGKGRTAVAQARLILLVMINVAQLWILAATVEAALAHRFSPLLPLVVASGICFLITLTLIFWWRPSSRRSTSSGYLKR